MDFFKKTKQLVSRNLHPIEKGIGFGFSSFWLAMAAVGTPLYAFSRDHVAERVGSGMAVVGFGMLGVNLVAILALAYHDRQPVADGVLEESLTISYQNGSQ